MRGAQKTNVNRKLEEADLIFMDDFEEFKTSVEEVIVDVL